MKNLVMIVCDFEEILYQECVPVGQIVSRQYDLDIIQIWESKWGGNICHDDGNKSCFCTLSMRLRTFSQCSNAPAHGLSGQQCACALSVSAAMHLRTFCQRSTSPAHGLSVQRFLAAKSVPFVPHPLYSPDLFPCDLVLFPRKKSSVRGGRFNGVPEVYVQSVSALHVVR